MRDIREFVSSVNAKLADISARSEAIKQETLEIALEVIDFTKEVEALPPSDARDLFLAALTNLKSVLVTLAAMPPALATKPGETRV